MVVVFLVIDLRLLHDEKELSLEAELLVRTISEKSISK